MYYRVTFIYDNNIRTHVESKKDLNELLKYLNEQKYYVISIDEIYHK